MTINCQRSLRQRGFSIAEFMVGIGVGALVIAAAVSLSVFSSRSMVSYFADTYLDMQNRRTVDQMTKDLRSVLMVTNFNTNSLVLVDNDGTALTYTYDSTNLTLTRIKGTYTNILLTDVNRLLFSVASRNMTNGTFNCYPTNDLAEAKIVTTSWCCTRKILGFRSDDMPQYFSVNLRNQ